MRYHTLALLATFVLGAPGRPEAQSVTIPGASPRAVVARAQVRLPERFVLRSSDEKSALFVLDQGLVPQRGGPLAGTAVPVAIELRIRFKQKKDGLFVTAAEEIVGAGGQAFEFRRPVQSPAERATLQRLLDAVRDDLAGPPAQADSGGSAA